MSANSAEVYVPNQSRLKSNYEQSHNIPLAWCWYRQLVVVYDTTSDMFKKIAIIKSGLKQFLLLQRQEKNSENRCLQGLSEPN